MISRRALLAGVAIAALSQGASASLRIRGAGAGGGGGGGGVGTIQPGAGWAGNAGDVAPPAMDATQQGSGWAYPAVGLAVEPMNMWVADTSFTVTVVAGNGDPARGGIAKVRFYLEGSGAVDVTTQAIDARTGVAGFTIKPQSRTTGTPLDGDANLVYDIYPVNGFVIRRTLTLVLNTNASITRTRRFISPTGTNSGSALSSGTAWATPGYAMSTCTSGDIIECAAGTYTDTNGPTNHTVARMVEFVLAAGLNRGDVIFKKADRSTLTVYTPRSTLTKFTKIKWDMNTYVKIGFPPGTCSFVFDQCDLIDSTGVQGPATCYSYLGTDQSNNTFDPAGNNRCALLNCTATNYCMTGWTMLRNTQLNTSADAVFISNVSDVAVVNSTATQTLPMYLRQHDLASLTLTGTVTFDGTYSTLNFSGSPTFNAITTDLANCFVMVLTGSVTPWDKVAGTGTRYTFHDISAGVVRVFGDATALVAGNTVWIGLVFHADSLQFTADVLASANNCSNIIFKQYLADGTEFQPWFFQAGPTTLTGAGTVGSYVGTTISFSGAHNLSVNSFVQLLSGTQIGEYARVIDPAPGGDTTKATLAHAFTGDNAGPTAGITWRNLRSVSNIYVGSSVFNQRNMTAALSQWQDGIYNCTFEYVTLLGTGFQLVNGNAGPPTNGHLGIEATGFYDCIMWNTASGTDTRVPLSALGTTASGMRMVNCAFVGGTLWGSTPVSAATTTFNAAFKPTSNLSKTITGVPLWDVYGVRMTGSSLIGGAQP